MGRNATGLKEAEEEGAWQESWGDRGRPVAHLRASSAEHRLLWTPAPWKSPAETGNQPDPEIFGNQRPDLGE